MPDPVTREDRRWSLWAGAIVAGVLTFSLLVGFVVLPLAQAPNANLDAWTAICRAVGLQPGTPAQPQPPVSATAAPVSQVRWTPATLQILAAADLRPGAALASAVCADCHGAEGFSTSADVPQLAGQSAPVIYKQLTDYRSGARAHPQMTDVAKALTEVQLAQIAAYYAGYRKHDALGRSGELPSDPIARLAHRGDPSRGLAPCESCHARASGGPPEAPILTGQRADYLVSQMKAFKTGQRRNDVYRRMRDVAEALTDDEIARLGQFYQGVY